MYIQFHLLWSPASFSFPPYTQFLGPPINRRQHAIKQPPGSLLWVVGWRTVPVIKLEVQHPGKALSASKLGGWSPYFQGCQPTWPQHLPTHLPKARSCLPPWTSLFIQGLTDLQEDTRAHQSPSGVQFWSWIPGAAQPSCCPAWGAPHIWEGAGVRWGHLVGRPQVDSPHIWNCTVGANVFLPVVLGF